MKKLILIICLLFSLNEAAFSQRQDSIILKSNNGIRNNSNASIITISICSKQNNKLIDSLCFKITNNTDENYWFYTPGLCSKLSVKDSKGNEVRCKFKFEELPDLIPEWILIKSYSDTSILKPIKKSLSRFDFIEDENYSLLYTYENFHFKKRKTKIKTFKGEYFITPFIFKY